MSTQYIEFRSSLHFGVFRVTASFVLLHCRPTDTTPPKTKRRPVEWTAHNEEEDNSVVDRRGSTHSHFALGTVPGALTRRGPRTRRGVR